MGVSWQPINWHKPPKGEVLLYWPASGVARGHVGYTHPEMMRVGLAGGTPFRPPTHWQPLPEPPQ